MINIGITGTLSSGKSTVAKLISGGKYSVFSADKSVKKKGKIKIIEIPHLNENKLNKYFDLIVNIAAKKELRLRRYLRRGGNKKIFTILDNRQFKNKKKIKNCDYVIYNNKSFKSLKKQVNKLKKRL